MRPFLPNSHPAVVHEHTLYQTDGQRAHWGPTYLVDGRYSPDLVRRVDDPAPPVVELVRDAIGKEYWSVELPPNFNLLRWRHVAHMVSRNSRIHVAIGGGEPPIIVTDMTNAARKRGIKCGLCAAGVRSQLLGEHARALEWPRPDDHRPEVWVDLAYLVDAICHVPLARVLLVRGSLDPILLGDATRGALIMPVLTPPPPPKDTP